MLADTDALWRYWQVFFAIMQRFWWPPPRNLRRRSPNLKSVFRLCEESTCVTMLPRCYRGKASRCERTTWSLHTKAVPSLKTLPAAVSHLRIQWPILLAWRPWWEWWKEIWWWWSHRPWSWAGLMHSFRDLLFVWLLLCNGVDLVCALTESAQWNCPSRSQSDSNQCSNPVSWPVTWMSDGYLAFRGTSWICSGFNQSLASSSAAITVRDVPITPCIFTILPVTFPQVDTYWFFWGCSCQSHGSANG